MGLVVLNLAVSCLKFPIREIEQNEEISYSGYNYPFALENRFILAEIVVETDGSLPLEDVELEIPPLKYNKSLLFFLTQDDCKQTAFCVTWAAINGRPLSTNYFYSLKHINFGIFPTDTLMLGKTLGSTDGAGNEVRFHFTTTIAPEMGFMTSDIDINRLRRVIDNNQFKERGGLMWEDIREMLNYGVGIAFHDNRTSDQSNVDSILKHYALSQNIILDSLAGRGCKTLAEPDGNKTYVEAALEYSPIQIMTAQTGTIELCPCKLDCETRGFLFNRGFYDTIGFRVAINDQFALPLKERHAIHVGVHETGVDWARALLWLNDTYGKDGLDSIWMPSLEEYCEYDFYRMNSSITRTITKNKIIVHLKIPMGQYFYSPSVTLNIKGLHKKNVIGLSSNYEVTGMSYDDYKDCFMLNIDCRRYLYQMASYYVGKYLASKSETDYMDALYFVSQLKESSGKQQLLAKLK